MVKADPKCLKCDAKLDDFASLNQAGTLPRENDISVCLYCGNVAIFTGNSMDLRPLTPEEKTLADEDYRVLFAQEFVRAMRDRR